MLKHLLNRQPTEQDAAQLTELMRLNAGQNELLKRLVRVETRLCNLLEVLEVRPSNKKDARHENL